MWQRAHRRIPSVITLTSQVAAADASQRIAPFYSSGRAGSRNGNDHVIIAGEPVRQAGKRRGEAWLSQRLFAERDEQVCILLEVRIQGALCGRLAGHGALRPSGNQPGERDREHHDSR